MDTPPRELEDLPNVGPTLAAALRAAGITDAVQLRATGSVEAWRRIHPQFDCLHSLLALEGAVQGIPKTHVHPSVRGRLAEVVRAEQQTSVAP